MSAFAAVVMTVALCALIGSAFVMSQIRRNRLRIQALMERIAEYEGGDEYTLPDSEAADRPVPADGASEVPSAITDSFGNDPLHGRTSDVRRIVEGERREPVDLAEQAIICAHRNLDHGYSAGRMADDLHVSIRTLERGINAELECSPSQLITAMRMREARRLLIDEKLRINEVASRLGFSTPEYFSRRFKSVFGLSPSKYLSRLEGR